MFFLASYLNEVFLLKTLIMEKLNVQVAVLCVKEQSLFKGLIKITQRSLTPSLKTVGIKVKSQVQDDQIRVTAKSRDDLQKIIQAVKEADLTVDVPIC